ncbi:MAG: hypothetical protein Q9M36_08585 [Sulfurovum sp.]|nr:hypothetical protein [Sulfurovum sp.]
MKYIVKKQYEAQRNEKNEKRKEKYRKENEDKIVEEKPIEVEESINLPLCTYSKFNHSRLLEMGLDEEEAENFVKELIPQLEKQIPDIEAVSKSANYVQLRKLIHANKGASNNLGTGGISDLLNEYDDYLRSLEEMEPEIIDAYTQYFVHYTKELKQHYT